ncbi:hypothetical protein ZWY2020_047948 [Hordeum vulgare]|nr:hypothetical protein ZWY2020_047948 [Hordeum vulgare]
MGTAAAGILVWPGDGGSRGVKAATDPVSSLAEAGGLVVGREEEQEVRREGAALGCTRSPTVNSTRRPQAPPSALISAAAAPIRSGGDHLRRQPATGASPPSPLAPVEVRPRCSSNRRRDGSLKIESSHSWVPGTNSLPEEAGKEVFRDTDISSHSEDDDKLKHLKRTVRSWV